MSSTYNAICLSHDPGIVLGPDMTREMAAGLNNRSLLTGHETCDIVIGRYSYPLVEVACLGTQLPGPSGCQGHHSNVGWIDRDWLRLLAAAAPLTSISKEVLQPLLGRCWTPERLHRLHDELGMPKDAPAPAAASVAATGANSSGPLCTAVLGLHEPGPDGPDVDFTRLRRCTVRGPHFEHTAADGTRWIRDEIPRTTEWTYTFSRGTTPAEPATARHFPPVAAPEA